jgi:RNA polymerase sigma-70 factor (ECF subfamily)
MNADSTSDTGEEAKLLAKARAGDEAAFATLAEKYRAALHAHCYRMLGSIQDAEDAYQESLIRAWRGIGKFEGRSSLRSWLYRIATNVSLDAIERRPSRVLATEHGPAAAPGDAPAPPLVESIWIDPYPDEELASEDGLAGPDARYEQRESVELAFIAALQHLPPLQRAVLILREVLGFSGEEVAEALDSTPAAVYSALQRAHKTVDEYLPEQSQQATVASLGDARVKRLVESYIEAWENADVDGIKSMLTEEAKIAMPPSPSWFQGREAVGEFLAEWPLAGNLEFRLVPTRAGGQIAFGSYSRRNGAGPFVGHAVEVLTLEGDQIAEISAFRDPAILEHFGLPAEIQP